MDAVVAVRVPMLAVLEGLCDPELEGVCAAVVVAVAVCVAVPLSDSVEEGVPEPVLKDE